jgi:hypothetical protein
MLREGSGRLSDRSVGCLGLVSPLYSLAEALHESTRIDWFMQEADCAGFQRLRFGLLIRKSGNEDHRSPISAVLHLALQLEAVDTGHLHI